VTCINKILLGSALHKLRELDDDFIDCCITSPLYWSLVAKNKTKPQLWDPIERVRWRGELGLEPTVEMYIAHLMTIFDEIKRVLKPQGSCTVVMGDTYVNKCLSLVPERFAMEMISRGWILRSKMVWQKSNFVSSSINRDRFDLNWENIYWFTKSKRCYFERNCQMLGAQNTNSSVLVIPTEPRPKHYKFPNFPSNLVKLLVCKTSPKNGIVLDPFMGSGTTALVAVEMGRNYLGVEVSKDFVDLAEKRIKDKRGAEAAG
jgi:site-specific DNA-methyltransferase (cytosine-N4-specific)